MNSYAQNNYNENRQGSQGSSAIQKDKSVPPKLPSVSNQQALRGPAVGNRNQSQKPVYGSGYSGGAGSYKYGGISGGIGGGIGSGGIGASGAAASGSGYTTQMPQKKSSGADMPSSSGGYQAKTYPKYGGGLGGGIGSGIGGGIGGGYKGTMGGGIGSSN